MIYLSAFADEAFVIAVKLLKGILNKCGYKENGFFLQNKY